MEFRSISGQNVLNVKLLRITLLFLTSF